jgi:hypothetical protein
MIQLNRQIQEARGPQAITEVTAEIEAARLAAWPWGLPSAAQRLVGSIQVQRSWLVQALWALISRTGVRHGNLQYRVGSFRPTSQWADGPAWRNDRGTYFQIVLEWTSLPNDFFSTTTNPDDDLLLKALRGLLTRANVGLDYRLLEKDQPRITLYTPWHGSRAPVREEPVALQDVPAQIPPPLG